MNKSLFVLIICLCFEMTGGCSGGPAKPAGFPKLYPVTLVLTQDGKPLAEATATLIPEDKSLKWGSGGFSDAEGKIELKTGNGFAGVPIGKFKVAVTKTITEGMAASPDEAGDPKTYTLVEKIYTEPATTTLTLDVTAESKELTLDVGKNVKIRVN
jgi:hypothetical protein